MDAKSYAQMLRDAYQSAEDAWEMLNDLDDQTHGGLPSELCLVYALLGQATTQLLPIVLAAEAVLPAAPLTPRMKKGPL